MNEAQRDRHTSTRRALVVGSAAALAGASCSRPNATGGAAAVHTRKRIEWTLVSSFPSSLDAMFGPAQSLADRVKAATDGAFDIRVHQAGEIVSAFEVLEAVQVGAVQVGQTASYYYTGKCAPLAFATCVPFGLTARQQQAWLREGGGDALIGELYADFGIVHFQAGNTGTQMGGWFRREVSAPADLKGLRMRIPGLGGEVMSALGVSVQQLPGGEIYTALEMDRIDATEWVGPYDDEKLGFHKVAKNYYYPGWWEPGPELSYLVNRVEWDDLPADYRAVFTAAARESGATMQERYDARNPAALARLVAQGVVVRPFSAELLEAAREASEDFLSTSAAKDPAYAKVLEPWRTFRAESNAWFGAAELAYAAFTHRPS
jgi:TRAP-type mannitol/chloroaromatic compound transport system substrate-binding protein